jgi:hypothetical protein
MFDTNFTHYILKEFSVTLMTVNATTETLLCNRVPGNGGFREYTVSQNSGIVHFASVFQATERKIIIIFLSILRPIKKYRTLSLAILTEQ